MSDMRNFSLVFLATLLLVLGGAATFNYLIDPYGVFGSKPLERLAGNKVAAIDQPDLAKTYMLERRDAKTILLGNSRVDLGLDPDSASWPSEWQPVFNLAVPGFYMNERVQHFQHALVNGNPARLVYGLSVDDFWPITPIPAADPEAKRINARLSVAPDGTQNHLAFVGRATDYAFALMSFRAMMDSVRTLRSQDDTTLSSITASGWNTGGSNDAQAAQDGYHEVADWKIRYKLPRLLAWAKDTRLDFSVFDRMVDDARAHRVKTVIFIAPSYVDEYVLYRELGLKDGYDSWKRQLTARIDQERNAGADIELWDFSGADQYSTEPMPQPGDTKTNLRWFWEAQHFKPALGEEVIKSITGESEGYGVKLTSENVEAHIQQANRALDQYYAERAADVARVRAVIEAAAKQQVDQPSSVARIESVSAQP